MNLRREIVNFLRRELMGPDPAMPAIQTGIGEGSFRGEEILRRNDPPRIRYGVGILFPQKAVVDECGTASEEEAEPAPTASDGLDTDMGTEPTSSSKGESAPGDSPDEIDLEVNRANQYLPSAVGITALVRVPNELKVHVQAGQYMRQELEGQGWVRKDGTYVPYRSWWRIPVEAEVMFDGHELLSKPVVIDEKPLPPDSRGRGLSVHIFSRLAPGGSGRDTHRIVTFTLLNRNERFGPRIRDEDCFFQCRFKVQSGDGSACFSEYPEAPVRDSDSLEHLSGRLLYRHEKVFAIGHGCAVGWKDPNGDSTASLWTDLIPEYELKPVLPTRLEGIDLSMVSLAQVDAKAIDTLKDLANRYEAWIEQRTREAQSESVPPELKPAAEDHLRLCRKCLERIRTGIDLLDTDHATQLAFALMNRAMLMQQVHYRVSTDRIRKWNMTKDSELVLEAPFVSPNHDDRSCVWRPFQIAFILMNLRSVTHPDSEERKTVDVIWFPTGGGKTEAYLGLAALVLFYRRLRSPTNAGTTIIMRYTLRLLTTQQYQRAASLICACEKIRRERRAQLGKEPFTIGLWVGGALSPNTDKAAVTSLQKVLRGDRENPFIILSCPWCGAQMGPVGRGQYLKCPGYKQYSRPARVRFVCADPDCEFHAEPGLPLQVVDEHIYSQPPSLLVGTVDKFALLPWRSEARSLFGRYGDCSPPDLIIQDELHLISGPLGSMVGLYESAIDVLTERADGGRAKIVASTATISRAGDQTAAVFGRPSFFLFPPQGLRAGDSFFAEERRDQPGRLYVGVFASGLPSHVTAQVRVLSALLQGPISSTDPNDLELDPFWTLVCYFNSIRELGHNATLLRADIREHLNSMWDRLGLMPPLASAERAKMRRFINRDIELTSRVPGSDIPEYLSQLFTKYSPGENRSVDVCLATNMIQVGLDVPRLSLMEIAGQPKTTSEYIQASSRVGREHPGLVVTTYNPARPRDRSHYEQFRGYHQSIYKFVEPTSVTPFAIPVRERALHAVLIALARHLGGDSLMKRPIPVPRPELSARVRRIIEERVEFVDYEERDSTLRMVAHFFDEWTRLPPPRYGSFGPPQEEVPLMYPSGSSPLPEWDGRAYAIPSSMRNVDAECDAKVISQYPALDSD